MGAIQDAVVEIVSSVVGVRPSKMSFCWLPNKYSEVRHRELAGLFESMLTSLGGSHQGMVAKGLRLLSVDAHFPDPLNFILEVDELQHFTPQKAQVLDRYPASLAVGFDIQEYLLYCRAYGERALKKGPPGYRKPTLDFPFPYGRVAQRALLDAFKDLLPPVNGLRPTLRIPAPRDEVDARDVERRAADYLRVASLG